MIKDDDVKVFNKLKADGILFNKAERKMVIRCLTRHLYSLHSSNPTSLTTLEKEGMAKSFVNTFPKYCGKYDDNNLPWDHVYCKKKNTGWIANASRAIQASNRCRTSKSKKSSASGATADENVNPEELDSDEVQSLALLVPGRSERQEVLKSMSNSFKRREIMRAKGTDISTFLVIFPHLISYEGELLRLEFKRMRPEAKDICRTFLPLQDKILKLPLKRPISLTHEDGTIRALMILSQHLPHDVPLRQDSHASSSSAKEEEIIKYVGTNENIEEFIAELRAELARPVQPYLLAVKSSVTKKVQKYFLVLDDKCMQLTNCQIIRALDHLMASYFVFNVSYPYGWRNTLHFIASTFYEIFENTPPGQRKDGVTPSERELWLLLQN